MLRGMDENFDVTGYQNPHEFLNALEDDHAFDLVICDLIMNSMNGLEFVKTLRSRSKKIPILMLSGINSAPPLDEAKLLGANGFIHKSSGHAILQEALVSVLDGRSYFQHDLDNATLMEPAKTNEFGSRHEYEKNPIPILAARQMEVLSLLADGASNK